MCVSSMAVLFFVNLSIISIYLFLFKKFLFFLKIDENSIWEELGSPSIFMNNTPKNMMATLGYLFSKKYSKSSSSRVVSYGNKTRALFIYYLFVILASTGYIIYAENLGSKSLLAVAGSA